MSTCFFNKKILTSFMTEIINLDKAIKILNRNNQIEKLSATVKERERFIPPSARRALKKKKNLSKVKPKKNKYDRGGLSSIFTSNS